MKHNPFIWKRKQVEWEFAKKTLQTNASWKSTQQAYYLLFSKIYPYQFEKIPNCDVDKVQQCMKTKWLHLTQLNPPNPFQSHSTEVFANIWNTLPQRGVTSTGQENSSPTGYIYTEICFASGYQW